MKRILLTTCSILIFFSSTIHAQNSFDEYFKDGMYYFDGIDVIRWQHGLHLVILILMAYLKISEEVIGVD